MTGTVAQNYATPVELESVRQLELVGNLVQDSRILGSVNPNTISAGIENVVVRTNVDLTKGSITLNFTYHSLTNVFIARVTFSEFGNDRTQGLTVITELFRAKGNTFPFNIKVNSKYVTDPQTGHEEWNIIISPKVSGFINLYSLSYDLSATNIIKPSDPGVTSYVKCQSGTTAQDGSSFNAQTWVSLEDKMYSNLPVGSIIEWCPQDNISQADPYNADLFDNSDWLPCDGRQYVREDGVTANTPNLNPNKQFHLIGTYNRNSVIFENSILDFRYLTPGIIHDNFRMQSGGTLESDNQFACIEYKIPEIYRDNSTLIINFLPNLSATIPYSYLATFAYNDNGTTLRMRRNYMSDLTHPPLLINPNSGDELIIICIDKSIQSLSMSWLNIRFKLARLANNVNIADNTLYRAVSPYDYTKFPIDDNVYQTTADDSADFTPTIVGKVDNQKIELAPLENYGTQVNKVTQNITLLENNDKNIINIIKIR